MFVAGQLYDRGEVQREFPRASADGCAVGDAGIALLVEVPTVGGHPCFEDRSALYWPGELPERAVERGARVFVFADEGAARLECLGEAGVASYSQRASRPCDVRFSLSPMLARARWLQLIGPQFPELVPAPAGALMQLTKHSDPSERWAALVQFMERWYQRPGAASGVEPVTGSAPLQLRKLIAVRAVIPEVFKFNQLLATPGPVAADDKLVFLTENQCVCLWATEAAGDDPRVWYRDNSDGQPWIEEGERLSGFLIQAVVFEAVLHARFGAYATWVDEDVRDAIVARVDPLIDPAWNWCGARFYARDGALVITMEDQGLVHLAAHSPLALTSFAELVADDWERVAF